MAKKKHKFLFVIGGVMSGVGKGIATASMCKILAARGYKVNLAKVDPYLNVDAGTMNTTEHGEVFVLDSGLETDQDMGNYERFLNRSLGSEDYMTSGMVYRDVLMKERNLEYGGKCIEAVPHVRDEIVQRYRVSAQQADSDVTVIEIGGTIGDFQNALFMDAARVMHMENPDDVRFIMVSYLPVPGTLGEMKTRPTQNAIRQLNGHGIQPHFIVARATVALDEKRKEKIASACAIKPDHVISAPDVKSVYDIPLNFEKDKLSDILIKELKLPKRTGTGLKKWQAFAKKAHNGKKTLKIGIIGKYFDTGDFVLSDAYLSVIEALKYSAYAQNAKPEIDWINSKDFEKGTLKVETLKQYDGILVPGGFGETGIEGKIQAIKYARENKIPYFGLCYGMQLLAIEYARNVAGIKDAHTAEIKPKGKNLIVDIMPEQKEKMKNKDYGATMRLGAYPCELKPKTIARKAYGSASISERHRHRFEINPEYVEPLQDAGLIFSGTSPDGTLMEVAEIPQSEHPFMLGTQFHPELKARPLDPHPLFNAFVKAALKK